jgi:hypothetical protein
MTYEEIDEALKDWEGYRETRVVRLFKIQNFVIG